MNNEITTVAKCWNEKADSFDAKHNEENIPLWLETLQQLMEKPDGAKLLDVGTGTGFVAQMACTLGCQVTGVDIAEEMLAQARQKAEHRGLSIVYTLVNGSLLPYPDQSFDYLTNSRLLWTLLDPQQTFQEWHRVLCPGGQVLSFMRLPKETSEEDLWCYDRELEEKMPLKYASKQEITEEFRKAGFSKVEVIDLSPELSTADLNPWYCIRSTR